MASCSRDPPVRGKPQTDVANQRSDDSISSSSESSSTSAIKKSSSSSSLSSTSGSRSPSVIATRRKMSRKSITLKGLTWNGGALARFIHCAAQEDQERPSAQPQSCGAGGIQSLRGSGRFLKSSRNPGGPRSKLERPGAPGRPRMPQRPALGGTVGHVGLGNPIATWLGQVLERPEVPTRTLQQARASQSTKEHREAQERSSAQGSRRPERSLMWRPAASLGAQEHQGAQERPGAQSITKTDRTQYATQ